MKLVMDDISWFMISDIDLQSLKQSLKQYYDIYIMTMVTVSIEMFKGFEATTG